MLHYKFSSIRRHLLEEGWQVNLAWVRIVFQAGQAFHWAIPWVPQIVLREGIREVMIPAQNTQQSLLGYRCFIE